MYQLIWTKLHGIGQALECTLINVAIKIQTLRTVSVLVEGRFAEQDFEFMRMLYGSFRGLLADVE